MPPKHQGGGPFIRVGLPLIVLTVGGWLGIAAFLQPRFDVKDARTSVDLSAPVEKQRAKKFNLEEELQRIRGQDVEQDFKNKPIGRPKDW